ncbi:MAG: hypothetical protein ABIT01_13060 [Thermoanaerobaculia bacterium]
MSPPRSRTRPSALLLSLLAVFLVLAGTADERTFGTIADEQEVLGTAVSIAELGELGIPRGQVFTVHRPAGDAVSPYGMGLALLEIPVAAVAFRWERLFGERSSQSLLLLLQILIVTAAAFASGLLARRLGAQAFGESVAVLGVGIASPMWAFAATGFSEPLQGACLAGALVCGASAVRARRRAVVLAMGAGFLAGYAVLAKGTNLALFPLVLAPLAFDQDLEAPLPFRRRISLALAAAAGAAVTLGTWLAFEVVRFGRPFASYGFGGFTHPFFDGLWRLLFGPNKGLLLYFPLLLLSVVGLVLAARSPGRRGTALGLAGPVAFCLGLYSVYSMWHGGNGWGPRYLVPLIPLLGAAAGGMADRTRTFRGLAITCLVAGFLVSALGVLESEAIATTYLISGEPTRLTAQESRSYPPYLVEQREDGTLRLSLLYTAHTDAALAPLRTHAFLLSSRLAASDREELARRLSLPPWLAKRPDVVPRRNAPRGTLFGILEDDLTAPFRWPFLGRVAITPLAERRLEYVGAWDNALRDQVLRLLDLSRPRDAVVLARRYDDLSRSGYAAALLAESLRASGQREDLAAFLSSLSDERRRSPFVAAVEALSARDQGDDVTARQRLAYAQRLLGQPALARLLQSPLASWPTGFRQLTASLLAPPRFLEQPGRSAR